MSGDFHVLVKVRNGRLVRRMRESGFTSVSQLCKAMGSSDQARVGQLLNFKISPLGKDDWSKLAMDISSALHCEPEEIWPDHIAKLRARKGEIGFYTDEEGLKHLPSHDFHADPIALRSMLDRLSDRELTIIKLRYAEGMSRDEIGKLQSVSGARIREIESKAICKMRRFSEAKKLKHIEDCIDR